MRTVLLVAVLLAISGKVFGSEVVGRIDGYEIVKEKDSYRIVPAGRNREEKKTIPSPSSFRPAGRKPQNSPENTYREIVYQLQHGAGEPVYSRIRGFDVERVLDRGKLFGAVISGSPDPELLRKAFKYVVRIGNRYYVVGEWEEK